MSNVAIIIPARAESTRFPNKPLAKINGRPMILHTCKNSSLAFGKEHVYVATASREISDVVSDAGYRVITTRVRGYATGSDRVADVASELPYYFFINVQGDEPLVDYKDLRELYCYMQNSPEVAHNFCQLQYVENVDCNTIKMVKDPDDMLLMASRDYKSYAWYKQVCLYGYSAPILDAVYGHSRIKTPWERYEDIEILRLLEYGYKVQMHETKSIYQSVDIPKDIAKVERILNER